MNLSEPLAVDETRMHRVIEFILGKRQKEDLVILFDGRSRPCRRVIEQSEAKMAASGAHTLTECWCVYVLPEKRKDARAPGRQCCFGSNNKEVAYCSLPNRKSLKVVQRSEFNTCGELSTVFTTYTGIVARRLAELPRMDYETKASIFGAADYGQVAQKKLQADIERHGHPFSLFEVKPLGFMQRILEHHNVTHIVDFAAGSGAIAIAASGAMDYDGVAANDNHEQWLNSTLDRCVMYLAGKDKDFGKKLSSSDEFAEKVAKYFGGTVMDARRILEPVDDEDEDEEDDDADEGESSAE